MPVCSTFHLKHQEKIYVYFVVSLCNDVCKKDRKRDGNNDTHHWKTFNGFISKYHRKYLI